MTHDQNHVMLEMTFLVSAFEALSVSEMAATTRFTAAPIDKKVRVVKSYAVLLTRTCYYKTYYIKMTMLEMDIG